MSESIAELRERLDADPGNVQVFEDYERALVQADDIEALVALYEGAQTALSGEISKYWMRLLRHIDRAVSRENDAERRGQLFLKIGQIYEEKLDRIDQANASYQQAYRVCPTLSEALDRARAIYSQAGNWDLVLRLWEMQSRNDRSAEGHADIFVAMGRVCLDHIGNGERATDFARRALTQVPGHAGAQAILDDYADLIRDWQGEVAVMMSDAREHSDTEQQVEAMQDVLSFVIDRVPLDKADGAPIAIELTTLEPSNIRSWILARSWYDRAGDAPAAEEAHRPLIGLLDGEGRIDALREAAKRAHTVEHLQHEISARRALVRAVPSDTENLDALEALVAADDHAELRMDIYEDALEMGAGERVELLRKAGHLGRDLERLEDAQTHFEALLDEDPEALDALEFLYERAVQREDYEAQYGYLIRWARLLPPEEAAARWAEVAGISDAKLQAPHNAIEAWRERLALLDGDEDARRGLHALYRRVENWEELTQLLEAELRRDAPIDAADELADELIALYTDTLGEHARALEHVHARVHGAPEDAGLGARLRTIARKAGNLEDVRTDLRMRIDAGDPDTRFGYVDAIARLELEVERPDDALPWLDELTQHPETGVDLLRIRRDMAADADDSARLIDIQSRIATRLADGDEGTDAYLRLAKYAENAGEYTIALDAYRTVIAKEGDVHDDARRGAMRALEATESWDELADLMDAELQYAPSSETHAKLARIAADHLDDMQRAATHRNDAIRLDPEDTDSARALIRYYAEQQAWADIERVATHTNLAKEGWDKAFEAWKRAVEGLAYEAYEAAGYTEVYRQLRQWADGTIKDPERTSNAAQLQAEHQDDEAAWVEAADSARDAGYHALEYAAIVRAAEHGDAPESIAVCWTRAAELAEGQDDIESDGWAERAHAWQAAPSVRKRRDNFAKSSIKTQRIDAYAKCLDAQLDDVEEDIRVLMLRDLGALYAGPLSDEAQARIYWEQLRALRPQDPDTLEALHGLYQAQMHPEPLLRVVDALLEQANRENQPELERERARLLDEHLHQDGEALLAWRTVRKQGGEYAITADERIEALLRKTERYDDLDTFFSEQLGMSDSRESAAHVLARRGVLRVGEGHREAEGIEDLLNVLGGFGDTPAADGAGEALRTYVTGEYPAVVDGLVQWHDAQERFQTADDLLEERVRAHGNNEKERWESLIARLRARREDSERLIEHWIGYQRAHASDRHESNEMMTWAREQGHSPELVRAWTECLVQIDTVPPWWQDYLMLAVESEGETDSVLQVLNRLRALEPTQFDAISDAVEELLASVGRFQEQVNAIVARADNETGENASDRYAAAAQIAEFELEDYEQAAGLYLKARTAAPNREAHIPELVRNLIGAQRWEDATGQLRAALDAFADSTNAPKWHAQLARASSRAGEPDEVVLDALREAAKMAPSEEEVGEGLSELAFREGVDPDIARSAATLHLSLGVADGDTGRELHERIVVLSPDPDRRLKALSALGDLLRHDEAHQRRAWEAFAEALTLEPGRGNTANRLERLAGELGEWRPTSDLFAQQGNAIEGDDGIKLLERAVRIEVEENEDLETAARYQEDLLDMEGDSDARLAILQQWYDTLGANEKVVRTVDRRAALAQQAQNTEHLRDMRLLAVQIVDERLQNHPDIVRRWREIIAAHPDAKMQGLEALSVAHRGESEWKELDDALTARIQHTEEMETRHRLLREQATLREEELQMPAGAIESLEQISKEDLEGIDVLHELDRLYLQTGDQRARYGCIQERFGRSGQIEDRLELARAGLPLDDERENAIETLSALMLDDTKVRLEALETFRELAENTPDALSLARWRLFAQILEEEQDLAAAARANIAIAQRVEPGEERRERGWTAIQQRLAAVDALEEAAEMASKMWMEEGCPDPREELVKSVVRQAQREELYAQAAEAHLEATPDAMDLREGLAQWYLEDKPDEDRRRVHLQALFDADPKNVAFYQDLLAITEPERQAPILRTRMNATSDDDERQRLRAELGLALSSSDDPDEKLEAQRLLEAYRMTQSTNEKVNGTLRHLLADGGHWAQLASLIEEELWLTDDADERVRLLVERARCREKEEALPSMLVEGWFDVLADRPSQADAIIALTEIAGNLDDSLLIARVQDRLELAYETAERWEDLYELLIVRSAQAEREERKDALRRAATVADKQLHDDRLVLDAYRRLISFDPSDATIVEHAVTLAETPDEQQSLRQAIEEGLEGAELEVDQQTLLRRRAALLIAAGSGAVEQAVEALSVLFDAQKPWQIVDDVETLYAGEPDAYVQWLRDRADAVDDLDLRIRLLRHASATLSALEGREEEAGAILDSIYTLRPSVEGAEELDALYARANLHNQRVIFWRARLQAEAPILAASELHHRLHHSLVADHAAWTDQIKQLGQWWDALNCQDKDGSGEPKEPTKKETKTWTTAFHTAIKNWSKTDERTEVEGDLLDALIKRVGIADKNDALFKARIGVVSSDERADILWEELVRQHAETTSLQKAWKTASTALRDAPERDARGASIEKLAQKLENYEEAAALLRHVADDDFERRYVLALRAARIDIEELRLLRRATKTLERVLEVKPDQRKARFLMHGILERNPRHELQKRIIEALIRTSVEPAEKASLAMISTTAAEERRDVREAKAGARRALDFDPGHADVRAFLLERRADPAWRAVIEDDLLPILRAEAAGEELRSVLEALSNSETNAKQKEAYDSELATLLAQDAESSGGGALSAWLDALRQHPHSPSYLQKSAAAIANEEDGSLFVDTASEIVESTTVPEVRAAIFAAIGHTQIETLGDPKAGAANLLRAIQENPRNEHALNGLETHYLDIEDYEGLATLLEARLAATEDPQMRRDLAKRLLTLLRGELNRPDDAARLMEDFLQSTGPDEDLYEALRITYHEAQNVLGEVRTLERLASLATDVDERIDLRTEALELARNDESLQERALALSESLLVDDMRQPLALQVRAQIFAAREDHTKALSAHFAVVDLHADDDVAADAIQNALSIPATDQKEVVQNMAKVIAAGVERDLLVVTHMEKLAAWLPMIPVAEQRRVVDFALDAPKSPERRSLLVAALVSLRPSSDEALGQRVADTIEGEPSMTIEEHTALARWYETANQYDKAIAILYTLAENIEDPVEEGNIVLRIAKMEEQRGRFDALMKLYERAQACGNTSPVLYKGLERGYERDGRWSELLTLLEQELPDASGKERIRLLRRKAGVYLQQFQDPTSACEALREAIDGGGGAIVRVELLEILVTCGEYEEAQSLIAALDNEELPRALMHRVELSRGRIALHERRYEDAKTALERAHGHAASHAITLVNLAQAHIALGEWEGALEALQAALVNQDQLQPVEKATTLVLFARVQAREGALERARELVTRALRLAPSLPAGHKLQQELDARG